MLESVNGQKSQVYQFQYLAAWHEDDIRIEICSAWQDTRAVAICSGLQVWQCCRHPTLAGAGCKPQWLPRHIVSWSPTGAGPANMRHQNNQPLNWGVTDVITIRYLSAWWCYRRYRLYFTIAIDGGIRWRKCAFSVTFQSISIAMKALSINEFTIYSVLCCNPE